MTSAKGGPEQPLQSKSREELIEDLVAAEARIAELETILASRAGQPQNVTGNTTEGMVRHRLEALGLIASKPFPDRGVDLEVRLPHAASPVVRLQVKGRGATQSNRRYRWFQVRTTSAQRRAATEAGFDVAETWRKKVELSDFLVLVALRFDEYWVLPREQAFELGELNRQVYGNRGDNRRGEQAELDLDIEIEGEPLTERFSAYRGAFHLIQAALRS